MTPISLRSMRDAAAAIAAPSRRARFSPAEASAKQHYYYFSHRVPSGMPVKCQSFQRRRRDFRRAGFASPTLMRAAGYRARS